MALCLDLMLEKTVVGGMGEEACAPKVMEKKTGGAGILCINKIQ